jgi:hypothetical protein
MFSKTIKEENVYQTPSDEQLIKNLDSNVYNFKKFI